MTVYNKASLVLAESPAYKAGKIQPYYPLTPDVSFDFTRATSATRVNASGNIEKETQNLLRQSNDFNNSAWLNYNTTRTSGQAGYDGSSDAWLFEKSAANGRIVQTLSQSGVQTFSTYAKAGSLNWLKLQVYDGTSLYYAHFDLANGVLGSGVGLIDRSITSVGGGWYRCSISININNQLVYIYPADGNNDTSGTSGNIYIQDAQLEQGLVARDYIETTATAIYGGITDNIPRLDYTDSSCPALLLEPQRTNLVPQSEYFEGYSKFGTITITSNYGISPEGVQNSTRVQFSGASNELAISTTASAGNVSTIYIKGTSGETIKFGSNGAEELFTLNGDWQRLEKYNAGAATKITLNTYSGATARDVEVWGAMQELGGYPTSYIPNHSGGSVTRAADECTKTSISGLIGQTEGTILCEFTLDKLGYDVDFLAINNSTNSEYIAIFKYASNVMRSRVRANSINNTIDHSITATGTYKVALKYNASTFALFVNGVKINEISATISFTSTIERIFVGPSLYVGLGKAKYGQLLTLTEALTDDECIALTTL
jgi:hypothetical protein